MAFPMFWLMDTKSVPLLFVAYLAMMTAFAANYGPIATVLAELFGSKVRYSGLSAAYMLSGLPVFARGTSCLTTKRIHGRGSAVNVPVMCGGVQVNPGDWVLGDDNGVIVLSREAADAVLGEGAGLRCGRTGPPGKGRVRGTAGNSAGPVTVRRGVRAGMR